MVNLVFYFRPRPCFSFSKTKRYRFKATIAANITPMGNELPTGQQLKSALIKRCLDYCERTGTPPTALSLALTGRTAFLGDIQKGGTIKLERFDGVMAKLDELELTNERLTYGAIKKSEAGSTKAAEHRRKGAAVS